MDKIYKTVVHKALDIRQQRTVISEKQKTKKVSPMVFSAYYLERVSKPWQREGKVRQPGRLPELRRQNIEFKEIEAARFHRTEEQREDRCTEIEY